MYVAGRKYGPTPADVELWGDTVEPGKEVRFVFRKEGFEQAVVTRVVRDENLRVEVSLDRVAQRRRGQGSRRETGADGPLVLPDDFKKDPY